MAEATGKSRQKPKKRAKRAGGRATFMFISACAVSIVLGYALGEYAVQLVNDGRFHLPRPRAEPLPLTLAPAATGDESGEPASPAQGGASAAATSSAAAGETGASSAASGETGASTAASGGTGASTAAAGETGVSTAAAGTEGVSADVASQLDTSGASFAAGSAPAALYRVQVGDYADRATAEAALKRLDPQGRSGYYIVAGPPYRVQVGAFSDAANADSVAEGLRAQGLAVVVLES